MTADALVKAARAWEALCHHAGADEGSAESRQIARDVMAILCAEGRQPGQVRPDHPDAGKPVGWGEHPRDCDCGDCP